VELPYKQYSQAAFRQTTATTGGSPTVDIALYEVDISTGLPGKQLVAFTQKAVGTANTTYQTTALSTPVICGGWMWGAFLFLVGGGSGGSFKATAPLAGGMNGTLFSASTAPSAPLTRASQTVLNDPATAPTTQQNATAAIAVTFT
jgi:hypothetical protein